MTKRLVLDTSALVRRYDGAEPGAATVRAICASGQGHVVAVTQLVSVEMAAAFSRKVREARLDSASANQLWTSFQTHLRDEYQTLRLSDEICSRAERLVFAHVLRSANAIHVASALELLRGLPDIDLQFWTADRRQAQAATAEGLVVHLVA